MANFICVLCGSITDGENMQAASGDCEKHEWVPTEFASTQLKKDGNKFGRQKKHMRKS